MLLLPRKLLQPIALLNASMARMDGEKCKEKCCAGGGVLKSVQMVDANLKSAGQMCMWERGR
jgi:hypothetical protein